MAHFMIYVTFPNGIVSGYSSGSLKGFCTFDVQKFCIYVQKFMYTNVVFCPFPSFCVALDAS